MRLRQMGAGIVIGCMMLDGTVMLGQSGGCTVPQTLPAVKPVATDVAYETDAHGGQTTLSLYLPELPTGAPKPRMVMLVHGGSWRAFANPEGMTEDAAYLTHFGFEVAVIQYRLLDAATKANQFPAGMQDARCAVRYLRANPRGFAYDGSKLGVLGSSAGGHMVSMLGVLPAGALPPDTFTDTPECLVRVDAASSAVDAVAAYFPFVNVTDKEALWSTVTGSQRRENGDKGMADYVGVKDVVDNIAVEKATPQYYLERYKFPLAPFVIVNGTADKVILPRQADDLEAALKTRGAPVQHFALAGLPHGFVAFDLKRYPVLEESACAVLEMFSKRLH